MAYYGTHFTRGVGAVFLVDLACTGSENALASCSRKDFGDVVSNCKNHLHDAFVECPTSNCELLF